MLSKSQISFVASLQQKKIRKQEGLFIAEGEKVVEELLASSWPVRKIYATEAFFDKYRHNKEKETVTEWMEVSETELKKISLLTTPNKALALAVIPDYHLEKEDFSKSLSLVLDDISDPGNLGTIIRIADWFGIENIVCSNETADCYNSKVVQASMGSLFRVKVHYTELKNFLEQNSKTTKSDVFGMVMDGESIYSASLSTHGFIVIGNESMGISDELKKYFSKTLCVPPFMNEPRNKIPDSLNAAVATAIACSEFRRRSSK